MARFGCVTFFLDVSPGLRMLNHSRFGAMRVMPRRAIKSANYEQGNQKETSDRSHTGEIGVPLSGRSSGMSTFRLTLTPR